jgi:hypothetical protein
MKSYSIKGASENPHHNNQRLLYSVAGFNNDINPKMRFSDNQQDGAVT